MSDTIRQLREPDRLIVVSKADNRLCIRCSVIRRPRVFSIPRETYEEVVDNRTILLRKALLVEVWTGATGVGESLPGSSFSAPVSSRCSLEDFYLSHFFGFATCTGHGDCLLGCTRTKNHVQLYFRVGYREPLALVASTGYCHNDIIPREQCLPDR